MKEPRNGKDYLDDEAAKKLEDERQEIRERQIENARHEFVRECAMHLYSGDSFPAAQPDRAVDYAERLAAELGKRGHFTTWPKN